jgi:hypothetical protein
MKHLKTFEELKPSTYRNLRNRTADYPWSQFAAKSPESKERAQKMARINQLTKERFETEFYNEFPLGTKIKVYDSLKPNNVIELSFNQLQWRANWTYYDLYFTGSNNVQIRLHGDSEIPYTLDRGERLGFSGEILIAEESIGLVKSMFDFGKDVVEPEMEITPEVKEKPKGFISKIKDFMK